MNRIIRKLIIIKIYILIIICQTNIYAQCTNCTIENPAINGSLNIPAGDTICITASQTAIATISLNGGQIKVCGAGVNFHVHGSISMNTGSIILSDCATMSVFGTCGDYQADGSLLYECSPSCGSNPLSITGTNVSCSPVCEPIFLALDDIELDYNKSGFYSFLEWNIEKIDLTQIDYFEVQESKNATVWIPIAVQNPKTSILSYTYTVPVKREVAYYRIKIVTLEGTHHYSKSIAIPGHKSESAQVRVFPNPSRNRILNIELPIAENPNGRIQISLFNLQGKPIFSKDIEALKDENIQLKLPEMEHGRYVLKLKMGANIFYRIIDIL